MEEYILQNFIRQFGNINIGIDEGRGESKSAMAIKCIKNKKYEDELKEMWNYAWKLPEQN